MKERKPGQIPEGRIGVYDAKKQLRGHVGPKASSVTCSRFHGQLGAKLGTVDGRLAWTLPQTSAAGAAAEPTGTNPAAMQPPAPKPPSMIQNLNAAKGSTK